METVVNELELPLRRLTITAMEALKDPNTKAQRKKHLARVASALLGADITSVTISGTCFTLGTPSEDGDDSDALSEEAASLVERMVDMHCSAG